MAFADFTLAMMALFMTLWIVNSVSKSERESIIAALHGQSIFSGGGLSPLNKISPSHPPKPATVAVPEETEKKSARRQRENSAAEEEIRHRAWRAGNQYQHHCP